MSAVLDQAVINDRLKRLCAVRHQARTDLMFLMRRILGYKDIEDAVHGPIVECLPKLYGGKDEILANGGFQYTPTVPLWELRGKRKRLILDPRGHLKTSIISQAGTIQWILNYPNIRLLITTATADLAQTILGEIKSHFQYNEILRSLFPDYCPQKSIKDFGNAESFSVPNRKRSAAREPTLFSTSVGKSVTGKHFDVEVCSDMVDEINSRTPGGIREVIEHFRHMDPLLERYSVPTDSGLPGEGFQIVEGTSYAFSDCYSKIIESQGHRITEFGPGRQVIETAEWIISHGNARVDAATKQTLWPARFSWEKLDRMEHNMGPSLFSAQMLNMPMADEGGLAQESQISWFSIQTLKQIRAMLRIHTTVDVAGMETDSRGDFTVLSTSGFDRDGRCYVLDIRRGHFSPTEVIWHIFDIWAIFKPIDIKIEKEAHSRVLGHFLARDMQKKQIFPPVMSIKRDTRTSKIQRIKGLEPWFAAKIVRFYDGIACKTDLVREIVEFPSSAHDDILDTIADQMQNRDGGVNYDVIPNAEDTPDSAPFLEKKLLAFGKTGLEWMKRADAMLDESENYHAMTGL